MGIPQIVMIVIFAIGLLLSANLHGKAREGKHSIWTTIVGTGMQVGILLWGGFFN